MANKSLVLYDVKPFGSIKEMLQMAVDENGDTIAYRYRKGEGVVDVSYRQFQAETLALGTELAAMGLASGHIAMLGENSYKWLCVYLMALQSEGVYVPLDKELPPADLVHVLTHSDSTVLFYSAQFEPFVRENRENLPQIRYFIGLEREEDDGEFLSYDALQARGQAKFEAGERAFADMKSDVLDTKMIVYTSGTTGAAKGVMLTEQNLCSCVYYGLQVSTLYQTGLSVLPYNHTYEAVAGILSAIHKRCTMCINENLRQVLKNLQFYKPDFVYLVPAFVEVFYRRILAAAKQEGKEAALKLLVKSSNAARLLGIDKRATLFKKIHENFGGNLKKIVCGGAPIRPELGDFFEGIGISLINGYGITECSPLVSVNQDQNNDCQTAGYPLPCLEVMLDEKTPDGNGEICVKGPTVMKGYYKMPEMTSEVIVDGFFHTGDYGKLNADGQLIITGRKKNLIVLDNGKNIFPEEIEKYLYKIPYVADAVVFAVKDETGQEVGLAAEVFLSAEQLEKRKVTNPEQALRRDINLGMLLLPAYKRISKIFIRPVEFEKTTTNKIKRSSLMFADTAHK